MAIVLDDNVNSAPRINEKIPNGSGAHHHGPQRGQELDEQLTGGEEPGAGAQGRRAAGAGDASARFARWARRWATS